MTRRLPYNFHHLYYFMVIAEEGGISAASKKLLVGQPALSAQLKQLESQLGFPLFDRIGKKLELTERGLLALQYAQSVFGLGDELFEVLNSRKQIERVHLRIGALDSVPKQVIQALAGTALSIGKVRISLLEGNSEDLFHRLGQFHLDIVVTNSGPSAGKHSKYLFKKFSNSSLGVYGAPKFKGLRKKFPESLSGQPFVVPTHESTLRHDFDSWVKARGLVVDPFLETQDIALTKLLAIQGMGLIPLAEHSVAAQVKRGDLVRIGLIERFSESLYLAVAERRMIHPVAAELFKSFSL